MTVKTYPHGDRKRYVNGPDEHDEPGKGCRCRRCKDANNAFARDVRRRKAQRGWAGKPTWVDAERVRQHVRALMAEGPGWEHIAEVAGVGQGTVSHLLYGGQGRLPTTRMRPDTAEKLLALRLEEVLLPGVMVDATGTRRRMQALAAIGWTASEQGRRIGWAPTNVTKLFRADKAKVEARTADLVRRLYDELSMTPAPPGRPATQARNWAARNGWLPPLAWDDDLIDLPDDELVAEVDRRAADMDDKELMGCWTARYKHGDQSPLITAGAREYIRRRKRTAVAS